MVQDHQRQVQRALAIVAVPETVTLSRVSETDSKQIEKVSLFYKVLQHRPEKALAKEPVGTIVAGTLLEECNPDASNDRAAAYESVVVQTGVASASDRRTRLSSPRVARRRGGDGSSDLSHRGRV